jgi:predicted transposase YbfD/YdcC
MGQPKGKIPAHIKPKTFHHPKSTQLITILSEVEDPRKPSCNFRHSLVTILFVTLVGVLCGAKNWEEIVQCAEGMIDWIGSFVDTSQGIPSSRTLKRLMSLIPTAALDRLLVNLRATVVESIGGTVAFDGKTLRGSRGWDDKDRPLHLLHAWGVENRIFLGQVSVDEKSNEITAMPKLIETLELRGTVVTADALNTQKSIAMAIINKGADYVLPVKGNHKDLLDDIEELFRDADRAEFRGLDSVQSGSIEKSGGRVEERSYDLLDAEDLPGREEWIGCKCVGRVTRKRTKDGKTSIEVCYYITSLDLNIDRFSKAVRGHWGVENGLHWSLDVIFDEDKHRYQDRIGTANLSLLRKIALAILSKDSSLKCGRAAKQMRAATSPLFREHLLKNCF